jgi:hypothetical protein
VDATSAATPAEGWKSSCASAAVHKGRLPTHAEPPPPPAAAALSLRTMSGYDNTVVFGSVAMTPPSHGGSVNGTPSRSPGIFPKKQFGLVRLNASGLHHLAYRQRRLLVCFLLENGPTARHLHPELFPQLDVALQQPPTATTAATAASSA